MIRLSLLPLLAIAAVAATPKAGVIETVQTVEKEWINAMVKADTATLQKLLADDLMYTHSDTRLETKEQILNGLASGKVKIQGMDLSDSKYRQYGDTVLATHSITMSNASGPLKLYVTLVWVKSGSGWQLASRQSTRFPQPK